MPGRISCPTLVGREEELHRVIDLLGGAEEPPPLALLRGDAGIGKTRLLRAAAQALESAGAIVLAGACIPLAGRSRPYGPLIDALRQHRPARDAGPDRHRVDHILTLIRAHRGASDPEQGVVLETVLTQLESWSEERPVVLAIEDLHWADAATLALLSYLVAARRSGRLSVIATVRADEPSSAAQPLIAELHRAGRLEMVELAALDDDGVRRMVAGILGHEPPLALESAVVGRSGGNPFFVEELVAAAASGEASLPSSLGQVLLSRVAGLPDDVQEVLRALAVVGDGADDELLLQILELDPTALTRELRTAVAAHVIRPMTVGRGYAFRHALVGEALHADLLPAERRQMHEAVARVLERRVAEHAAPEDLLALARHWDEAGDVERALPALVEAADVAVRLHAYADAVELYRRAMTLGRDAGPSKHSPIDASVLCEQAARAAYLAGDTGSAIGFAERSIAAIDPEADPVRAGRLHQHLSEYLWQHGLERQSLDAAERAVQLVPAAGAPTVRAFVVAAWGAALTVVSRYAEAAAVVEEAIELASQADDAASLSMACSVRGVARMCLGAPDAGAEDLERAMEIAAQSPDPDVQAMAFVDSAWAFCTVLNDVERSRRVVERWQGLQRAGGVDRVRGAWVAGVAGEIAIRGGDWDEAGRLLEAGRGRLARGPMRLEILHILASLRTWQDRLDEAARIMPEIREGASTVIGQQFVGTAYAAMADFEAWSGRPEVAVELVREARGRMLEPDDPLFTRRLYAVGTRALADLAPSVSEARRADLARMADELVAASRYPGLPRAAAELPETVAWRSQAEAERARLDGDHAANAGSWAAVATRWKAVGRRDWEAFAHWRTAEAEWLAGARQAAAAAAQMALECAESVGARIISRHAAPLAGVKRPVRGALAAPRPRGLTDRELEVLELLAGGMTNRQIAGRLIISEKTAGVHVSNILAKLDASTRTQAATMAMREGIVSP